MTPVLAVAAGDRAVASLRKRLAPSVAAGAVEMAGDGDLAVAFSPRSRWVDTHDAGGVFVVVDGSLHHPAPAAGPGGAASALHRRYLDRGNLMADGVLGDFMVVVLDRPARRLIVARDPLGVRPWYRARSGSHHAGATDVATLAGLPWVDTTVDEAVAVAHLGAVTASRGATVYRGIGTLPPGHTWRHDGEGTSIDRHHRWDLSPDLGVTWDEAVERCREMLDDAVRDRLRGGGAATGELSGGLDSSAVIGTMARLGVADLAAARLVFETPAADERVYSDAVADHWSIPLVSVPPTVNDDEVLSELTARLRVPVPDPNFGMFTGLHRALAGQNRWLSLTGLGGDDAFLTSDNAGRAISSLQLRQWGALRQLLGYTVRQPGEAWRELVRPLLVRLAARDHPPMPSWVSGEAVARAGLEDLLHGRPEKVTGIDAVDQRIDNLTSGYDAAILEARATVTDAEGRRETHPFLDPRLIEATYGLDPWWATEGGHNRAMEVAAYRDRLPPLVADRRSKAEFSEVFWPELLGDRLIHRVRTGPLVELGWLDLAGFDVVVQGAKEGKAFRAIPLSRCVSVDRWLRSL